MATDIGPKIGIDGEAEFRKQINNISQQVKTYASEMQVLSTAFDENADAEDVLTQKSAVLTQSIEAQQRKVELLQKGLSEAAQRFGAADDKTLRWQQAVNRATVDLNKMQSELKQNESAMSGLESETDDVSDALDDAGDSAAGFGDVLKASLAADVITGTLSGIVDGLKQATEESREYRKIMGSLEISSEKAGYSADETKAAYDELYGVLADNQTAATTTANLQALGLEQDKLNQLINGTIGAWATYGDSIPIDGLAEAINETAKVGTVTGTFADVLNWAGSSEDEFNERLSKCSDASERANLILQELSKQGLVAAGEGWQQNNASLVAANQAAADYELQMAQIGQTVEPVFTAIQTGLNTILSLVLMLLQNVNFEVLAAGISEVSNFFSDLVTGVQSGSITIEDVFQQILQALQQVLQDLLSYLASNIPKFLSSGIEMVSAIVNGLLQAAPQIVSTTGDMIAQFIAAILQGAPQALGSGAQLVISLISGIVQTTPQLVIEAAQAVAQFCSTILEHLPEILETGIRLLGEIIAGIIQAIPDLIAAIPKVISAIKDTLMATDWGELGINILKGLANGILDGVGAVVDAAKDAAGRIANAFKDFFDINSPSKWAEDEVSGNIMRGQARGFNRYADLAVSAARSAAGKIADVFPESVNIPVYANGTAMAYDRMADQLGNLQVVLNDGTLVGKLAPKLNNTLGGYARKEGRFGV